LVPTWTDVGIAQVLIAGPQGVAAVRLDDGHLAWYFPARASHFQRTSGCVVFLEDGRLIAVSAFSGRVLWQREAPGAAFLPTRGRFLPTYFAASERVLIQTATGRRLLLDADTGRTLADDPSPQPWPTAPLLFADHRILVVEDGRRLVALDDRTGREIWTSAVNPPSTISGEPPSVRVSHWSKTVLVLTQTNLGPRLQCLDADTGKPAWATMPFLDPGTTDPADWGVDEKTVYVPQCRKLIALALADGKTRWETTLPGPGTAWRASNEIEFLLVHPARVPEWRFQFRSPLLAVQWGISLPPEERPGAGYPLLALNPATGRIEQRWNLPAGPMRSHSYPTETAMWPSFEIMRGTSPAGLNVLQTLGYMRTHIVLTLGGRAWGM
jgi:outer membrane protein assembly factor BamB